MVEATKELLDKVRFTSTAKVGLSPKEKQRLSAVGVDCEARMVEDHILYRVGGRFMSQLQFVDRGSETIVQKYKPGDWEGKLDSASEIALTSYDWDTILNIARAAARFVYEQSVVEEQLKGLRVGWLALIQDRAPVGHVWDGVERLERLVTTHPENADAWGYLCLLYTAAGARFKRAAEAAQRAVVLNYYQPFYHYWLAASYFPALCEWVERKNPSLFAEMPERITVPGKTLEALGCDCKYAMEIVEKHLEEVVRLSIAGELAEEAKERLETIRFLKGRVLEEMFREETVRSKIIGGVLEKASLLTRHESVMLRTKALGLSLVGPFPINDKLADRQKIAAWFNDPHAVPDPFDLMALPRPITLDSSTVEAILQKVLQDEYDSCWEIAERQALTKSGQR